MQPLSTDPAVVGLAADALRRLGWSNGRVQMALLAAGCRLALVARSCGVSPSTVHTNCVRRSRRIHRRPSAKEVALACAALAGAQHLGGGS